MVERVKDSWIKGQLEQLNNRSKQHYKIYSAYSRQQLVVAVGKSGGISTVSFSHTKRELYDVLYALNVYLDKEKQEKLTDEK